MDVATYQRIGMMNLVLAALEAGPPADFVARVRLADPVTAFHDVSRDLTVSRPLPLAAGGQATAIDIQRAYLDLARAVALTEVGSPVVSGEAVARRVAELAGRAGSPRAAGDDATFSGAGSAGGAGGSAPGELDAETADVLARWDELLTTLAAGDLATAARRVEWAAKYQLLDALRARYGLSWDDARIQAAGLQWCDIRPERSLAAKLAAAGAVDVLADDAAVTRAVHQPPATTRAWLRGGLVGRFAPAVPLAGWDAVTVDTGERDLVRVAAPDPHRAGAADPAVAAALAATTPAEAIAALR
jgi:proteasome accessory factor A